MPATPASPADLTRARRERDRDALASGGIVDVLVIGGGITGAGVALDAATRGLSTALVEATDLAFGTSRWSSKLIHGGLRYLAHGDVAVAWESAVERSHLMGTIAPHLIRPLPHVMPAFDDTALRDRALVGAGLRAADLLRVAARTPRGALARPRRIKAEQVLTLVPAIDASRLRGGTVHWDGQVVDDARLVTSIARTAAAYGTSVLTRTRAISVSGEGARVRDMLSGAEYDIRARHVIVATGVWTGTLDPATRILPSRGSHAVLDPAALGFPRAALTVPVPHERGRFVFALPTTDGPVIAGITDEPEPAPMPDVPLAPAADIDWILEQLSSALSRPLSQADVIGTYAGLRPLVAPAEGANADDTADISRRHLVERTSDGAIVVTGGKLTTYRRMAQDAVDALDLGSASITATTPLVGAQPYRTPASRGVPARLVRHYGAEAARVAAWASNDPALLAPVAPGVGVLGVEIVHAIRAEGALSIDDIVERRTRLSVTPASLARARERVIEIACSVDPAMEGS